MTGIDYAKYVKPKKKGWLFRFSDYVFLRSTLE